MCYKHKASLQALMGRGESRLCCTTGCLSARVPIIYDVCPKVKTSISVCACEAWACCCIVAYGARGVDCMHRNACRQEVVVRYKSNSLVSAQARGRRCQRAVGATIVLGEFLLVLLLRPQQACTYALDLPLARTGRHTPDVSEAAVRAPHRCDALCRVSGRAGPATRAFIHVNNTAVNEAAACMHACATL